MLKNGTLLKVSPELIQALKNALDLRYLPLIQQANRRQRRQLLNDDVAQPDLEHPFKIQLFSELDEKEQSVQKIRVAGGPVLAYDQRYTSPAQVFDLGEGGHVHLVVWVNSYHMNITQMEVHYGKDLLYFIEKDEFGDKYAFPLGVVTVTDGLVGIEQLQHSSIVTPFRREYIPLIDESLSALLKIEDDVPPYAKFTLQEDPMYGAPDSEKDDAYLKQRNGTLGWNIGGTTDIKVHESLSALLEVNEHGELCLAAAEENRKGGMVLSVNSNNDAVEWITVSGGVAEIGVITSSPDDGSGAAKWAPITLSSDGSYTISGPSEEVILPEY